MPNGLLSLERANATISSIFQPFASNERVVRGI